MHKSCSFSRARQRCDYAPIPKEPSARLQWVSTFIKNNKSRDIEIAVVTHCEIIFDKFRVCVKDNVISSTDLKILWVEDGNDPVEISVESNGRVNYWPVGFFDSQENVLNELLSSDKLIVSQA